MKIKSLIIGLAAAVAGAVSANAQTLGVNYLEVNGGYSQVKVPGLKYNTWNTGLEANHALTVNPNYGIDLNYGGSLSVDDKKNFTSQNQGVGVGLTAYYQLANELRIFARGGLGWAWSRMSVPGFSDKANSWSWTAGAGLEWTFAQGWSLTPAVDYIDFPDFHKAEELTLSVELNWWFDPSWAVSVGYAYNDLNSGEANTGTLAFKFRY